RHVPYTTLFRSLVRGQANGGADGRPAIAAAASDTLHHHAARTVARRRNGGAASRLDSSAMAAGSASAANSNGCEAKGDCRAVAPASAAASDTLRLDGVRAGTRCADCARDIFQQDTAC